LDFFHNCVYSLCGHHLDVTAKSNDPPDLFIDNLNLSSTNLVNSNSGVEYNNCKRKHCRYYGGLDHSFNDDSLANGVDDRDSDDDHTSAISFINNNQSSNDDHCDCYAFLAPYIIDRLHFVNDGLQCDINSNYINSDPKRKRSDVYNSPMSCINY
jgi:hypothetical protein